MAGVCDVGEAVAGEVRGEGGDPAGGLLDVAGVFWGGVWMMGGDGLESELECQGKDVVQKIESGGCLLLNTNSSIVFLEALDECWDSVEIYGAECGVGFDDLGR